MNIEQECNELIRSGFHEVNDVWRRYARIRPVRNYRTINGEKPIDTYATTNRLTAEEIEGGFYRQRMRTMGRDAAEKLNEIIWGVVADFGGPSSCQDAFKSLPDGLDERMASIELELSFLHGQQYPVVEICDDGSRDGVQFRCFFDVGVNAWPGIDPKAEDEALRQLYEELTRHGGSYDEP